MNSTKRKGFIGRAFSNKRCQMALMIGAILVGGAGLLSGAWQMSVGDPASLAGLVGGTVTLTIGFYGLRRLTHSAHR